MTHSSTLKICLLGLGVLVAGCSHTTRKAPEAVQSKELTVLTYNIWHDQADWPKRLDYMLEEIRRIDPDIIGLQEVIQRAELENQAKTIANELGYYLYFSTVDPPERETRYGNAILSRFPFAENNMKKLDPLDDYRTVAHAAMNIHGVQLDIYNTHLHHTREGGNIRKTQIADLLEFIESTRTGKQVILMGDFNTAPDQPELDIVLENFKDTYALFNEDHLGDAHVTLNYHLGHSMRRIDYVFLSNTTESVLVPTSSSVVLDQPGPGGIWASDHFGVVTKFLLKPTK